MADHQGEHVHWADDGRGRRTVLVDGVPRYGVVYADTQAGVIVKFDIPLRSTDGETVDIHPEWGVTEVRLNQN